MNFCSKCGAPLARRVPQHDERPRHVCDVCASVFYENPKMITGCLPCREDKVLLCRRALAPRHGFWTLPAGYLEIGESAAEGAAREAMEEANARVRIDRLFCCFSIPRIGQVYLLFLASLTDLEFHSGPESLETALFPESEIPWERLAFPAVELALELYFADRRREACRTHVRDLHRRPGEPRQGTGDA